jgi:hypothetical protein
MQTTELNSDIYFAFQFVSHHWTGACSCCLSCTRERFAGSLSYLPFFQPVTSVCSPVLITVTYHHYHHRHLRGRSAADVVSAFTAHACVLSAGQGCVKCSYTSQWRNTFVTTLATDFPALWCASVRLLNFMSLTQKSRGAEIINEKGHLGFKRIDVSATLKCILNSRRAVHWVHLAQNLNLWPASWTQSANLGNCTSK